MITKVTQSFITYEVGRRFLEVSSLQGKNYCLADDVGPYDGQAIARFVVGYEWEDAEPEEWRYRYIYPAGQALAVQVCDRNWQFLKRQEFGLPDGIGSKRIVTSAQHGISLLVDFRPDYPMRCGLAGHYRFAVEGV